MGIYVYTIYIYVYIHSIYYIGYIIHYITLQYFYTFYIYIYIDSLYIYIHMTGYFKDYWAHFRTGMHQPSLIIVPQTVCPH